MKRVLNSVAILLVLFDAASPAFAQTAQNVIVLISDGWGENQIQGIGVFKMGYFSVYYACDLESVIVNIPKPLTT